MVRRLISFALLAAFVVFAATVPLGKRTLFGHIARIWQAEETQELVDGVKDSAGPLVDKAKRAGEAGWDAFQGDGGTPPAGKNGPAPAGQAGDTPGGPDGERGTADGEQGTADGEQGTAGDDRGVLDRARDRATDELAETAGDLAKDATEREVKAKLRGD